jgi:hypothetical protein
MTDQLVVYGILVLIAVLLIMIIKDTVQEFWKWIINKFFN